MKSASILPAGGKKRLSFNETQSRAALFNFRQLCLPLTKNTVLRHTNRKETKYFPNNGLPRLLQILFLGGGEKVIGQGSSQHSQYPVIDSHSKESLFCEGSDRNDSDPW